MEQNKFLKGIFQLIFMNPFSVLNAAIKKVPFVKYALGVSALSAAISIVKAFKIESYTIPVTTICIFLLLMLLLFIFSRIATSKDRHPRLGGNILMYSTVFIICASSILFTSSIFFNYPKPISEYPFFKTEQIIPLRDTLKLSDTIILNRKVNEIPSSKKSRISSSGNEQISDDPLEISIQLESTAGGFTSIKVNNIGAEVLATSTPFNPRIVVKSDPNKTQQIELITLNGDTCYLNRVFDKKMKQYFPIRFIPVCKTKLL